MGRFIFLGLLLILTQSSAFSQTTSEIDFLLTEVGKTVNSKDIIENKSAKKLMDYGNKTIPILLSLFTDSTKTKTYSNCLNRFLEKGEIAIILADRIEMIPSYPLTGVQNCLFAFCENNPNSIEYYLDKIKQTGIESFQQRYISWLGSEERKEWPFYNSQNSTKKKK